MNAHASGATKNVTGGCPTSHVHRISYTDATAVAKKLSTITGSATEPVAYRVSLVIETPSNAATSHTLSVGITGAGYTDIINAADVKTPVAGDNVTVTNPFRIATSEVTLYAVPTIVGAVSAGVFTIILEVMPLPL